VQLARDGQDLLSSADDTSVEVDSYGGSTSCLPGALAAAVRVMGACGSPACVTDGPSEFSALCSPTQLLESDAFSGPHVLKAADPAMPASGSLGSTTFLEDANLSDSAAADQPAYLSSPSRSVFLNLIVRLLRKVADRRLHHLPSLDGSLTWYMPVSILQCQLMNVSYTTCPHALNTMHLSIYSELPKHKMTFK
jgi:hypothetical protein